MTTGTISKRYAKAFYEFCTENSAAENCYRQAQMLLQGGQPEALCPELEKLIKLLVKSGRLPYVKFILADFISLYDQAHNIVRVRITSAVELQDAELRIKEYLQSKFGGEIAFSKKVDPALIGGFVLEVKDKVMDTSIKTALDSIERRLDELNKRIV